MPISDYEWHDAKNEINQQKHGIDFIDAIEVFDHPHLTMPSRFADQRRYVSLGLMAGTSSPSSGRIAAV